MTSETIADIVAEMRELADDIEAGNAVVGQTVWRNYADRIEAAADCLREDVIAETVKAAAKSAAEVYEPHIHDDNPSNAAAMREALEKCRALAETIWQSEGGEDVSAEIAELKDLINDALAAPPRNCDVGTAKEQELRYQATGELYHTLTLQDTLAWAQMPYAEGGAK